MIARRLTTFVAAGTIVLAACGGGDDTSAPSADAGTAAPVPADATSPDATAAPSPATGAPDTAAPAPAPAETPTTGSSATPTPTEAPIAVPASLDFTAQTLDGSEIEMGEFAGRPVLLWFWAPW
ncbi:MAG: hypothetical protein KDB37_19125 [Ilumatobacter sp.]|nr:hypothetical protein [Ilumatobacter sp.]